MLHFSFAKVEWQGNSFANYLDKITCLIMVLLFRLHLRKQINHVMITFKRLHLEKYSLPHVMISFNRLHLEKYGLPQVMVTLMKVHPLPQ